MPEVTKRLAKEYLAKNDELSAWFLEEYEEENKVDAAGFIVNFVSLKDVKELYVSQPIFTSMHKEDQRKFSTKKFKEDFEKNIHILLKTHFKPAMKVKLASNKKLNTKEGLIHFKRRVDHDEGEDEPAAQRPRTLVEPAPFTRVVSDLPNGMGGLNEYLNLGGVEVAEPEQEARETRSH